MNRAIRIMITFMISFIITYVIAGYVINTMFFAIHWVDNVTTWDKLRWYYIGSAGIDFLVALIVASIPTGIVAFLSRDKDSHE